ncbi:MAG: DUF3179 domain-containing (seleno)protein [Sphingomonadales bacterium]
MSGSEMMAIAAVLLGGLGVLPGTLGVLMFTHKIAASATGARFIYGQALWVVVLSVGLMAAAIYQALPITTIPWVLTGAVLAYGGIMVFGFLMHTSRNFRPIRQPTFVSMGEALAKFGPGEEVVGVIDGNGRPFAFITKLARRPHIVYQAEGDAPFIMTHCILAHSSMSYAMEGKFANPDISVTAVLANNMVFYEKSNNCSVIQLHNQATEGGLPLKTVPTVSCSLGTWQALYPESKVWLRDIEWRDIFYLKLLARADVIDPKSPVKVYSLNHDDDNRLPMKSTVIGVKIDGESRTYPTPLFKDRQLVEDQVGGVDLLIAAARDADFVQVYDRQLDDGATLTFKPSQTADQFVDNETGSEWAPTGDCVAGVHKGKRLQPIPHYNKMFWYVWSDFHPGSEIHGAPAD